MIARRRPAGGRSSPSRSSTPKPTVRPDADADGVAARRVALEVLLRIDREGAYANLVLPGALARSGLDERDRAFVTELVYGTTRMRRACDWLIERFILRELDSPTRATLRLGAYQLVFLETPPHAAVSATVGIAPPRTKGLVNAVLRRVAEADRNWPDEPTRLSYPDWIVDRLTTDLGPDRAVAALEAMDERATSVERDDGYHQDPASQWVADEVCAEPGDRVLDLCAAPGGKATALAATGAWVVAADARHGRSKLVAENAERLGSAPLAIITADGNRPPFAPDSFDRILVDAPCSGIGSLRRRADARWRIEPDDVATLAILQRSLVDAAAPLLRPGGTLVYSVCTLTAAETIDVDRWLESSQPQLEAVAPPGLPWRPHGRGALLLPQRADSMAGATDGMFVLRLRRRAV
jgi:16S rRNA (cytosine967-C5)-methyltransferase